MPNEPSLHEILNEGLQECHDLIARLQAAKRLMFEVRDGGSADAHTIYEVQAFANPSFGTHDNIRATSQVSLTRAFGNAKRIIRKRTGSENWGYHWQVAVIVTDGKWLRHRIPVGLSHYLHLLPGGTAG